MTFLEASRCAQENGGGHPVGLRVKNHVMADGDFTEVGKMSRFRDLHIT